MSEEQPTQLDAFRPDGTTCMVLERDRAQFEALGYRFADTSYDSPAPRDSVDPSDGTPLPAESQATDTLLVDVQRDDADPRDLDFTEPVTAPTVDVEAFVKPDLQGKPKRAPRKKG